MILDLRPSLFWDHDFNKIDLQKHKEIVIERVTTRGLWKEFQDILTYYGENELIAVLKEVRYLDKKTLSYVAVRFNVPLSDFRCYKLAQSNQEHWSY